MRTLLKKKINFTTYFVIAGTILIIIGVLITSYDYLSSKKLNAYNYINLLLYEETNDNNIDLPEVEELESETTKPVEKTPSYNMIATLEIPKISLKRGLVAYGSKYNNVKYNIQILDSSTMPDIERGNLILAAHSGTMAISFFRNLYKLSLGDVAYVNYNKIKYSYKISKIYTQPKTGKLTIKKDNNKTTLTLITCTYKNKTTQTVYILEQTGLEAI